MECDYIEVWLYLVFVYVVFDIKGFSKSVIFKDISEKFVFMIDKSEEVVFIVNISEKGIFIVGIVVEKVLPVILSLKSSLGLMAVLS